MIFLAETSQPLSDSWTPTAVIAVATAIVTLIAGTLIPKIITLLDKVKELQEGLTRALVELGEVKGNVQGQAQSITRVTDRMNTQEATVVDVAKNMTLPPPIAVVAPLAAQPITAAAPSPPVPQPTGAAAQLTQELREMRQTLKAVVDALAAQTPKKPTRPKENE